MTMPLCDDLLLSGGRWASAALDAYSSDHPKHDFAVHHMAMAVEHVAKAYLASITEMLLIEERPHIEDVLLLAGCADRTTRQQSDIKTIGGSGAIARAEKLLANTAANPDSLRRLRETRNGIAHLGQKIDPAQCRELLGAAINFIDGLLSAMSYEKKSFWKDRGSLANYIVAEAITEIELRYEAKLHRARLTFNQRFNSMPEQERAHAIETISSVPVLARWRMVSPETCPACGSPAMVSGRDYSEDFGAWFAPKFFGCRACDLSLEGGELKLAGFDNIWLDEERGQIEEETEAGDD